MRGLGLYIHIPFCPQLCPYCAFATLRGGGEFYERYVTAVCNEIRGARQLARGGILDTVFLGGGTPSMLAPTQVQRMLEAVATWLGLGVDVEITIEVNPGTADFEKFKAFKEIGCNRLSLGVQSFTEESLTALGRMHSAAEAEMAFEKARGAGFDNVSLDLIAGIPGVPLDHWHYSLNRAVALAPEHLSAYALTIEKGTLFADRLRQGRLPLVSEEEDAKGYEWAMDCLGKAGYEHYEVSNFALPGRRSRHNWGYWTGVEYLGVGLSAHSFVNGCRSWNTRDLPEYLEAVEGGGSPRAGHEYIDDATARREQVWMGLRTIEGVELELEEQVLLQQETRFQALLEAGYLYLDGKRLYPHDKGFLLADALGVELMDLLEGKAVEHTGTTHRKETV